MKHKRHIRKERVLKKGKSINGDDSDLLKPLVVVVEEDPLFDTEDQDVVQRRVSPVLSSLLLLFLIIC